MRRRPGLAGREQQAHLEVLFSLKNRLLDP